MNPPTLETLFESYRLNHDPGALGQIFDRTAPELLRVARYLVRDRQAAEDVVQETFLAAIQDASSFDTTRFLKPWLLGILVRRAALWRRRQQRQPLPEDVDRGVEGIADPLGAAARGELQTLVSEAVAALPERYREVVRQHLEERRGVEVARRLQRNPATVRTQLARGLAWLRGLLPRGVGGSALVLLTARRSLAAVRSRVLGAAFPELSAAGSGSGLGLLGGLAVNKILLAVFPAVALLLAVHLFLGEGDKAPPATPLAAAPAVPPEPPAAISEEPPSPQRTAVAEEAAVSRELAEDVPASYRAALAGLTGRLLEAEHTARAGATVTLLELQVGDLLAFMGEKPGSGEATFDPCVASSVTDAEGYFSFAGVEPAGLHALDIDLGTDRATLRFVDLTLASGVTTDLGDVVLDAVCALQGKVVDEQGKPVPEARVRAGCLPLPFLADVISELRSDSQVLVREHGRSLVLQPPRGIAALLDRLPLASTYTRPDGSFALAGAPVGIVTLLVQREGFGAACAGPFPTGKGERRVPDVTLRRRPACPGEVIDALGNPVPDAQVLSGALGYEGFVLLRPCGRTDAAGAFSWELAPAATRVWHAARCTSGDSWTVVSTSPGDPVQIQLPATARLCITLRGLDGGSVPAAHFRLLAKTTGDLANLAERIGSQWDTEADEYGAHVLGPVTQGSYVLIASAEGCVSLSETVEVRDDPTRLELSLTPGVEQPLRLLDDATSLPVEHARVTVSTGAEVEVLRSDADGRVQLHDVAANRTLRLLVEHPAFPTQQCKVQTGEGEVEVRVCPGGTLQGSVSFGEPVMVVVTCSGFPDSPPFLQVPDAAGTFRIERLPAGAVHVSVYPRCLTGDPLSTALPAMEALRRDLAECKVSIRDGEVTEVELPEPEQPRARLAGVVLERGLPVADQEVHLSGADLRGATLSTTTDARGNFRLQSVPPGTFLVCTSRGLLEHRERVDLEPGQDRYLEVHLDPRPLVLEIVRGPGRTPVANADLQISGNFAEEALLHWEAARTDDRGRVELEAPGPGTYALAVQCPAISSAPAWCNATVPATGAAAVVVHFVAVECEGTLQLPPGVVPEAEETVSLVLETTSEAGGQLFQQRLRATAPPLAFRLAVPPGRYRVTLLGKGYRSRTLEVEVPPEGSRGLRWEFERE